mgnify:FL=1
MTVHFFSENNQVAHVIKEVFPTIIVDRCFRITYVNHVFCELVKQKQEDLIDEPLDVLHIHSEEYGDLTCIREATFEEENFIQTEVEYLDRQGRIFWASAFITYLLDKEENITNYLIIFTEHLRSALRENLPIHPLQFLQTLELAINESNAVVVTDHEGVILSVNKRYTELSRFEPHEVIGKTPAVVKSGYQSKAFYKDMWGTILSGKIWTGELLNLAKDGSKYWVHSTTVPILNRQGKPVLFIAIQTDITRRIEAEHSLQKALKNDFDTTVKNLYNIVFKYREVDGEIEFTLCEGKMLEDLNLSLEDMSMEKITQRHRKEEADKINYHFRLALSGHQTDLEVELYDYTLLIYLSPIFSGDDVEEVVGTIVDITNRKKAENLAKHMAYYDFLTQLPNRRYLQEKVEQFIFEHEMNNQSFALMFIDIDRFKSINDSMGHSAGDQLLIQMAKRLQSIVRQEDFIARLGGDEFIILFPNIDREKIETIANNLVEELSHPFQHRHLEIFIRPSIGISLFPKDGIDYDTLIGSADIAMYKNKKDVNSDYQFFNQQLRKDILERTLLEMDLKQAIEREQFKLVYQPIYHLETKKMVGIEALLRWNHPVKGYIPPPKFIPIAEDSGSIIPIGQWVLKEACRQLKSWHDTGFKELTVAVNISIAQFNHPNFAQFVEEALDYAELDAQYLNLEVTEGMMLDEQISSQKLKLLRQLGVNISIDDFGTGYSSLHYLSNYPITHLKIDQSFIRNLTNSNRAIVKTIIALAKALQVKVIAEGVETEEHERFLQELNCDEVQGYYYSKPISASDIGSLLKTEQ